MLILQNFGQTVLTTLQKVLADRQTCPGRPLSVHDIEGMQMPKRSKGEQLLGSHLCTCFGQAAVSAASKALDAIPFCAPAAAAMGLLFGKAVMVGGW